MSKILCPFEIGTYPHRACLTAISPLKFRNPPPTISIVAHSECNIVCIHNAEKRYIRN